MNSRFSATTIRAVFNQFVPAMSQTQRIQRLIQHVEGKPALLQDLLDQVRDANLPGFEAIMAP